MIALFRNYTPFAVFLLFFLAVFTRLPYLNLQPTVAVSNLSNYPIWQAIYQWWLSFTGNGIFLNGLMVVLLILAQALALNKIANRFDLFNNPSYLTAMTYILVVGLVPTWNVLSIYSVANLLLILLLEKCIRIYVDGNNPFLLVNIGILTVSIVILLNIPALLFLLAVISSLLVFKPFQWKDMARIFFGFFTPYYLLVGFLYLNNNTQLIQSLFHYEFHWFFQTKPNVQFLIGISAAVALTIGGSFYLSKVISRMVIHTKRFWWVIFIFFVCSALLLPFTFDTSYSNTILLTPYLALLSTNLWLEHRKKWIANAVLATLILIVLGLQWF